MEHTVFKCISSCWWFHTSPCQMTSRLTAKTWHSGGSPELKTWSLPLVLKLEVDAVNVSQDWPAALVFNLLMVPRVFRVRVASPLNIGKKERKAASVHSGPVHAGISHVCACVFVFCTKVTFNLSKSTFIRRASALLLKAASKGTTSEATNREWPRVLHVSTMCASAPLAKLLRCACWEKWGGVGGGGREGTQGPLFLWPSLRVHGALEAHVTHSFQCSLQRWKLWLLVGQILLPCIINVIFCPLFFFFL